MSVNEGFSGWRPNDIQSALEYFWNEFQFEKRTTKRQRMIACLIVASRHNRPITRFDAAYVGDSCLNTTISEIERHDGIKIARKSVKRRNRFGEKTTVNAYWFEPESIIRAEAYLVSLAVWEAA